MNQDSYKRKYIKALWRLKMAKSIIEGKASLEDEENWMEEINFLLTFEYDEMYDAEGRPR